MAGGKRASMREGPLSQLFKRTDVDEEQQPREQSSRQPDEPQQRPEEQAPAADRGLDYAQPRIPTPKERLSAAFAHDIPHDVMEPSGKREYRPRDEPQISSR